jgi:hypothetical protein
MLTINKLQTREDEWLGVFDSPLATLPLLLTKTHKNWRLD